MNNYREKEIESIKQEVFEKFGKSILDLTKEEVNKSSIRVQKEYKKLLGLLTWEISKYTNPTVIYVDTLNDLKNKLDEFKTDYYKKK